MTENKREGSGGRNWWWKEFQRPPFARIFRKFWVNLYCFVKNKAEKEGFGEVVTRITGQKRVPEHIRGHSIINILEMSPLEY